MEDDEEDQTPISDLTITPSKENASPDDESTSDVEWLPEDRQESGKPHQDGQAEETQLISNEISLYDHLNEQLSLAKVDQKDKQIIMYLIGNLDEDGFFKGRYQRTAPYTSCELQIDQEEMQIALKQLQNLAPQGLHLRSIGVLNCSSQPCRMIHRSKVWQ